MTELINGKGAPGSTEPPEPARASLSQIAIVFLRLGITAFGGPAAHVAMMESEFVRRRRWITHERFLDLLAASNLIPGPSSTELAVYLGYEQAGWRGLVLGGTCFILPSALLVGLIAWAYVHFGTLPALAGVLYGIKPVVIAVVFQALVRLAPKAVKKSKLLGAIAIGACIASVLGAEPVLVLLAAGTLTVLLRRLVERSETSDGAHAFAPFLATATAAGAAAPVGLLPLFLTFLKTGALVFGSGYVLLAFLRADLVNRLHWLSEPQLVDAVAVGQVTPGPVFTTATFIGYLVGGASGAVVATVGIFLPGFVLVVVTRPLIARVRRSVSAASFLDGVSVASVALMAEVTVALARSALVDVLTCLIAMGGAVLLLSSKVNSTWLIAGAALIGVLAHGL